MSLSIDTIIEHINKQPDFLNSKELEKWAEKVAESTNTKNMDYLEGNTFEKIQKDIIVSLSNIIPSKIINNYLYKLKEYRYIDEIGELFRGKFIRWIRIPEKSNSFKSIPALTHGGIVTDIRFLENGIHIQCKNVQNMFMQYKFDECLTFQKLSSDEMILLHTNSHLEKKK
jgi:hypothetical protein